MKSVEQQILAGAVATGKFYDYGKAIDVKGPVDVWFHNGLDGVVLFVVFFTQACRWNRCQACNLPSKMSVDHVSFAQIMEQVDILFSRADLIERSAQISRVVVSNNGSVLDEETFSSTALMYLISKINQRLPNLKTLSLETRPEYVDLHELEFISRALKEGATPTGLELSIGFEVFDDSLRNDVFQKGLELSKFEAFVKKVAQYGFDISCYFMQKPIVEMSDEAAIEDIRSGIKYLGEVARKYGVSLTMYLNPTYAAKGTELERAFNEGRYVPPMLADVASAVMAADGENVRIFVGLNDEGLAIEGGSFIRPGDESMVAALADFNETQDFRKLAIMVKG